LLKCKIHAPFGVFEPAKPTLSIFSGRIPSIPLPADLSGCRQS